MTVAYPTKTITLQSAYTVRIAIIKQSLTSQSISNSLKTIVIVIVTTMFMDGAVIMTQPLQEFTRFI